MSSRKTTNRTDNGTDIESLRKELARLRAEVTRVRRHNTSLASQVNNLLQVVKEQDQKKRDLQERNTVNSKTGLPNRNMMDQELHTHFGSSSKSGIRTPGALMVIKLDNNYYNINKTLKPTVSEWIIYQIGVRLKEIIGENTPIYHARDDEFVVYLKDKGSQSAVIPILKKIFTHVTKPHIFSGYNITISCQIGVSFFPKNGAAKASLLNAADIALNHAKKNNRLCACYAEHMREAVVKNMELQNSIIKALEDQSLREIDTQFLIQMQPIVTVSEIVDNVPKIKVMNAEALIRWRHPKKGIIAPDTFIPVAEETGLIMIIGKWVLYTAAAQIESWSKIDGIDSSLAINVSPRQFNNDDLLESVERIINFRSIDPSRLQIEITENSFLDQPEEAGRKIAKLKDLGIRVAIDDFGTGFSSVNYLRKLPVDVVKIDRSFITNIVQSRQDRSIVKALIAMTAELGMSNVVEGVETLEQLQLLTEFGINTFQGYFFSKPLPPDEYNRFYTKTFKSP